MRLSLARSSPLLALLGAAPSPALAAPGSSILDPLLSVVQSWASGEGLVQGALGAVEGALGAEQAFDYVVVGGGTAGNVVGTRLAEAGFSVAVVEAGLNYEIEKPVLGTTPTGGIVGIGSGSLDQIPTVDWGFVTTPQPGANDREVPYARGRCLGGSSAVNFMVYQRGTEGSYQKWADQVGDDSYTFDNLLLYFEKAVNFTPPENDKRFPNASVEYDPTVFDPSADGPVQVGYTNWSTVWSTWAAKAMEKLGMKATTQCSSGKLDGFHYAQTTIRHSDETRSSSAQYIYEARGKTLDSLKVFTQTLARKVLFDGDKKATGVVVTSLGVDYTIRARNEVVLSAGAFQSPQLLMVSGVGPRAALEEQGIDVVHELPGVGQDMEDHVFFGPTYQATFDTLVRTLRDPVALSAALAEYVLNHEGPLTSPVAEFIGWAKVPDHLRQDWAPETHAALAALPADWPEIELLPAAGYIGDFKTPALKQPFDGKQYGSMLGAIVAPQSRGNVTIRSASTTDLPTISPNWLTARADQDVAVALWRRTREILAVMKELGAVTGDEYWPGYDVETYDEILDVIRDSMLTVWHAACTCKMGKQSDPRAVVDSHARVFGVDGLRVVDASSFPFLPPGHPQSTIYALAEKIAADIVGGAKKN